MKMRKYIFIFQHFCFIAENITYTVQRLYWDLRTKNKIFVYMITIFSCNKYILNLEGIINVIYRTGSIKIFRCFAKQDSPMKSLNFCKQGKVRKNTGF